MYISQNQYVLIFQDFRVLQLGTVTVAEELFTAPVPVDPESFDWSFERKALTICALVLRTGEVSFCINFFSTVQPVQLDLHDFDAPGTLS